MRSACGHDELANSDDPEEPKRKKDTIMNNIESEFRELHNTSFTSKFTHPFQTPGLIIICLGYAGIQLAFVLCGALAINNEGVLVIQVLNGGGWVLYYMVAGAVVIIANLYVLAVAAVWITIIAIAVVVSLIIFFILVVSVIIFSVFIVAVKAIQWARS